jgi:hypothetical protein
MSAPRPSSTVDAPAVVDDEVPREWLSIEDPGEQRTWLFDVSFLVSNWTCIYGRGCPGIEEEPAPERQLGCCSHGAYLGDKPDRVRVRAAIAALEPGEWQLRAEAEAAGGALWKDEEGWWRTRVHDGACVLQNRPDHPGGAGCALHQAAVRRGAPLADWKPEVCWQAPVRREDTEDSNGHVWSQIREWKRRDWGEGGADFGWWCIEEEAAYVGHEPVYVALEEDLVNLTSRAVYDELRSLLDGRAATTWLAHPVVRRRA